MPNLPAGGGPRWIPPHAGAGRKVPVARPLQIPTAIPVYGRPAGPIPVAPPVAIPTAVPVYERPTGPVPVAPPVLPPAPVPIPPPPVTIHIHRGPKPAHGHRQGYAQSEEELFLSGVRATVDSTWIREVQYVPDMSRMRIWFLDGYSVTVLKVSPEEAAALYHGDSVGGWYHDNVLGRGYVPGNPTKALKEWLVGA